MRPVAPATATSAPAAPARNGVRRGSPMVGRGRRPPRERALQLAAVDDERRAQPRRAEQLAPQVLGVELLVLPDPHQRLAHDGSHDLVDRPVRPPERRRPPPGRRPPRSARVRARAGATARARPLAAQPAAPATRPGVAGRRRGPPPRARSPRADHRADRCFRRGALDVPPRRQACGCQSAGAGSADRATPASSSSRPVVLDQCAPRSHASPNASADST